MFNPKISVVLPSYNRANYISYAIESCLNQTYKNFELIIVDDCSRDNSVEIIKDWMERDKRVKLIINDSNKKLPATLNIGFREAKGKYLTWISDDNFFAQDALEKMKRILDTKPEIGLVYADYTIINQDNKIQNRIYQEPPEYLPIRDCVGACFLYRSEIAKEVGEYNEQLFLVEDYEYWLRFGLVTKFHQLAESLYFYRSHPESLTKRRKVEIAQAKRFLKSQFKNQYKILPELVPINNLYMWFISEKTFVSYFNLLWIVARNPIKTLTYITKNLGRL